MLVVDAVNNSVGIGVATVQTGGKFEVSDTGNSLVRVSSGASGIAGIDLGTISDAALARIRLNNNTKELSISTNQTNAPLGLTSSGALTLTANAGQDTLVIDSNKFLFNRAVEQQLAIGGIVALYQSSAAGGIQLTVRGTHASSLPIVQLDKAGNVWNIENGRVSDEWGLYNSGTKLALATSGALSLGQQATTSNSINGKLKSSTTADTQAARIVWSWNVSTHASREADLALYASDYGGEREGLRIRANGTEPETSVNGATPIARQLLATGAGATVDDIITVLQNFGIAKQS